MRPPRPCCGDENGRQISINSLQLGMLSGPSADGNGPAENSYKGLIYQFTLVFKEFAVAHRAAGDIHLLIGAIMQSLDTGTFETATSENNSVAVQDAATPEFDYDLFVIGSGPSGQRAAIQAAKLGKRVAMAEMKSVLGGTCINTGTIPSKTLREAALHLSGYRERSIYGAAYSVKHGITMGDLLYRAETVIRNEIDVTQHQLQRNNVEMYNARASFAGPNTINLELSGNRGRREVSAEKIIISVGTQTPWTDTVEFDGQRIFNSDDILGLEKLPRSIAIVGAGVNLVLDDSGTCTEACVVLGAVGPTTIVVADAAAALVGGKVDDTALAAVAAAASAAATPIDDKRGTVEYRTKVAGVMASRAAAIAADRARSK